MHGETLPARSVAVACTRVVELSGTLTVIPGSANCAAEPCASGDPEQSEVKNSRTADPISAAPDTTGALALAGEPGVATSEAGGSGATLSSGKTYAAPRRWLTPSAPAATAPAVIPSLPQRVTCRPVQRDQLGPLSRVLPARAGVGEQIGGALILVGAEILGGGADDDAVPVGVDRPAEAVERRPIGRGQLAGLVEFPQPPTGSKT